MNRTAGTSILLALAFAGVQQACQHRPDPQLVADVEDLVKQVGALRDELNAIDTTALVHMKDRFNNERARIEERFADTLGKEEAVILGNHHRTMAQALPNTLRETQRETTELDSMLHRLMDLQHDLGQGLMKEEEEASAIAQERNTLLQHITAVDAILARADHLRRAHDITHNAVDSLLSVAPSNR